MNLFKKKNGNLPYIYSIIVEPKLDVLNLIIRNSPNKYNLDKLHKKIKELNPLYTEMNRPLKRTDELYYKYNILYGSNTNKMIRTYSPKMRPISSSIASFNQVLIKDTQSDCHVFTEEDMDELLAAKTKDLQIDYREEMRYKFSEYCRRKCVNRSVDFTDCYVSYYFVNVLSNIIRITDKIAFLDLSKNNIGDLGVEILCNAIENSTSLVMLNITSNNISHKGGEMIFNMMMTQCSIISLNISSIEGINRNRICCEGIKLIVPVLQTNFYIEELSLGGNSIKNEGLKLLCMGMIDNPSLHKLDISNNDINHTGLIAYFDKIKGSKLIELNISNNPIKNEGLMKITDCLGNFGFIKKLNVSNCGIEFAGFSYLFLNLQNIKRLENINLSHNDLRSDNFESVKLYFQQCGVKYLNLSKCNLGNYSGYALGLCLQVNDSIRKIEIRENKISDKAFRSYISLPKVNSSIEWFDVSKNLITDLTANDFIQNLSNNKTMKQINFYDNQLKNDSGTAMIEVLIKNKHITYVNFVFNRIQLKLIDEINRRIRDNIDKNKKRFLPNLVQDIKQLQFKPEEFVQLRKKIKSENYTSINLISKLEEDTELFANMKTNDEQKYEEVIEESSLIEEEIKALDEQLIKLMAQIKYAQSSVIGQREKIITEIDVTTTEIAEQKKVNEVVANEKNDLLGGYEFEINQLNAKLKLSHERMNLSSISLSTLKNDLRKKNETLANLNKPETIGTSRRQSRGGYSPRQSFAGSPKRRSSLMNTKESPAKERITLNEMDENEGKGVKGKGKGKKGKGKGGKGKVAAKGKGKGAKGKKGNEKPAEVIEIKEEEKPVIRLVDNPKEIMKQVLIPGILIKNIIATNDKSPLQSDNNLTSKDKESNDSKPLNDIEQQKQHALIENLTTKPTEGNLQPLPTFPSIK